MLSEHPSPEAAKITLFYDVASPYSYLAFDLLLRVEREWGVSVTLKPALIGGIFKAVGNVPPAATVREKGVFMNNDMKRTARLHGIPFHGLPANSPGRRNPKPPIFSNMKAMRLLTACFQKHGSDDQRYRQLIRQTYLRVMVEHGGAPVHLDEPALHTAMLQSGLATADAEELLGLSGQDTCKEGLKALTAEALAGGAFGLPFLVLEGPGVRPDERFWFGADSLHNIGIVLGKSVPRSQQLNSVERSALRTQTAPSAQGRSKL